MNLLKDLNSKQIEAVTSDFKINRVVAGAGSGKTRVLTYRLVYLLEKLGYLPSEVLAITFTNKASKEMKDRTIKLLKDSDIDLTYLEISTFHSYCAKFLRKEIKHINFPQSFTIIDDDDKINVLKNALINLGFPHQKTDPFFGNSLKFINKHKVLGELPNNIEKFTLTDLERKYLEVFEEYERIKIGSFALDFDDLLIYTRNILLNFPRVKESYNKRYKEILVDEFQDTNDLQYELITLLLGKDTGLFVVGDPDQTIYTWRGANQNIILDMKSRYKDLKTTILDENYRSTSKILEASNALISNNKDRIKKELYTRRDTSEEVEVYKLDNEFREAKFVASKIIELHSKGINYKDIAVLYRSSYVSRSFEQSLLSSKIPYRIYSGVKFFERKEVKDVLAYLSLIVSPTNDIAFERIYNVPRRKIGEKTFKDFKMEAIENNLHLLEYADLISEKNTKLKGGIVNTLHELSLMIKNVREELTNSGLIVENIDNFLKDIGYYDYLVENEKEKDEERLGNVRELLNDIRSQVKDDPNFTLNDYLQNVTLITNQDEIDENIDSVTLMTCHVAKGLEYKYVFIVGFVEGVFPNYRAYQEGEKRVEEERRLAYVAMTRAKDKLFITFNLSSSFNGGDNTPSKFIKEAKLSYKDPLKGYLVDTSSRKYSFDFRSDKEKEKRKIEQYENVVGVNLNNNIEWEIGDKVNHKTFGKGVVLKIDGNIITIEFETHGVKRLIKSHPLLNKE